MRPITLNAAADRPRLVLTCEHASPHMPDEYQGLGLSTADRSEHIAWDIGAAAVTEELAAQLGAPAVLSAASRLLVDCNRDVRDADLIPATSHGVAIPGNAGIDGDERGRRLVRFYEPYHSAVDAVLSGCPQALLLSVHSFTPELNGSLRGFDVGVLFDGFEVLAHTLADAIATTGLAVRMNEPYSALDGLIFSARSHGRGHRVPYLEIEINNRLLRADATVRAIASQLATAISQLLDVSHSGPLQNSTGPSRRRFAPPQGERKTEKSARAEEPRRGVSKH